jgi:hypothetical protein
MTIDRRWDAAQKRIMIDFDGVIHNYSKGFLDGIPYDRPIDGAMEALYTLFEAGYEIVIFSSRNRSLKHIPYWMNKWMIEGKEFAYRVTNIKEPARIYIDDRAIRFITWKDTLNYLM